MRFYSFLLSLFIYDPSGNRICAAVLIITVLTSYSAREKKCTSVFTRHRVDFIFRLNARVKNVAVSAFSLIAYSRQSTSKKNIKTTTKKMIRNHGKSIVIKSDIKTKKKKKKRNVASTTSSYIREQIITLWFFAYLVVLFHSGAKTRWHAKPNQSKMKKNERTMGIFFTPCTR